MDERGYGELLDLIYSAAIEPELWAHVLTRLSDSVRSNGAAFIDQHQLSHQGAGLVSRIDPAVIEPYFRYYTHINPLLFGEADYIKRRLSLWTPEIYHDEEVVSKSELVRTEYYNDFLRRIDVHSVLTIGLHVRGLNGVLINLLRSPREDQFGPAELELLRRLHPHLIRAYQMTLKLAGLRQLAGDAAEAMDRSPYGLVLTDGEGRVRRMNPLAERLTGDGRGLLVLGGRLSAMRSEDARRIEALVGAAASADPAQRVGGSMAVASPAGGLPLSITVAPIRSTRSPLFEEGPSVIVCITDLEAGAKLPEQRLLDLFGFTPAEARVALALLEGGGPREAAEGLGLSVNTVRTHLARVFQKSGTSRQSELVRMMMRAIGADLTG